MEQAHSSISNFRKFLFKILLPSLAVVIFISILFNFLFERYIILGADLTGAYKVNRIFNYYDSTETPIFGSSHCLNGLIPDSIGKNFFNYSMLGAGQSTLNAFLKEECKKRKTSPLIIVDISQDSFLSRIDNPSPFLYNANEPQVRKLMGGYYKDIYKIPFVRYFGFFETYFREYMDIRAQKVFENKGSSLFKSSLPPELFENAVKKRMELNDEFATNKKIEDEFFDVISHNPNRFFLCLITPLHKSYFYHYEYTPDFLNIIKRMHSFQNVKLLNLSKENYPDSLFYNTVHLNYHGAIRLSEQLRDSLVSLNIPAITRSLKK